MEIDEDKIDDAVLTLLWLTLHNERWTNRERDEHPTAFVC